MNSVKANEIQELYRFFCQEYDNGSLTMIPEQEQDSRLLLDTATKLITLSRRQNQLNERACNVGLTDREQKRSDAIDAEATQLLANIGLSCYTNGDPRGYPFGALSPSKRYNGWGGVECGWRF